MLSIRVLFLALRVVTAAVAQTPSSAVETSLQAILAEIHQLRQDLQATTVTAQRVQILLYRVQLQQQSTARMATRADEVHAKLANAQEARARNAKDVEQFQECVNSETDPNKIKGCQAVLTDRKRSLEIWQSDEQQWLGKDAEAQSQLRAEQAKLDQLQDTLDRLDKALAAIARQ
jgi:chromosome segregation ATPase